MHLLVFKIYDAICTPVISPTMNENVRPENFFLKNVIVRNNWFKRTFAHVKKIPRNFKDLQFIIST